MRLEDAYDERFLEVADHWSSDHPKETLLFVDYGSLVMAVAFPVGGVLDPDPRAFRTYLPDEGAYNDLPLNDEVCQDAMQAMVKWVEKNAVDAELRVNNRQMIVFEVGSPEDPEIGYGVFDLMVLH